MNDTKAMRGLTTDEVVKRREQFGENSLPEEKKASVGKILWNQIKSPLIYIILLAAGISLAVGEIGDFIIIMIVIVVNVILGFFQEFQAQRTYIALKGLLHPTTTVIREGKREEVDVWELVPGDIVLLNAGEKVPGDGILIETTRLSLDESILTGESEPVIKQAITEDFREKYRYNSGLLNDQKFMAYMGTTVTTGRGMMQIERTGLNTELGQIAASLEKTTEADTPFQIRLKAFSRSLTWLVVGVTALILIVGLLMGYDFVDMTRTAIVLAIAAVPEGLLIAVTVILVLGMRRIFSRQGLVKKLLAVETLGSVTVICTDKTGTLTEGSMRVNRTEINDHALCFQTMVYCNNLEGPVDVALWQYAAHQLQIDPQELIEQSQRIAEEPFTSEKKHMITQVTGGIFGESQYFFVKGAPEIVMDMCDLGVPESNLADLIDEWAGQGMRLLGLAYRDGGIIDDCQSYTWAGLIGMEDPIRSDVIQSIKAAQRAGIQIKMITGDYKKTAERIALNIGMLDKEQQILTGDDIASMNDDTLREQMDRTAVFARIRPNEKYRIIDALRRNGEITAMIGDGVNDAPALKRSDIGVVVGTATDVAKENADLILLDNRFSTVVAAIEEGRIIFANVRKVVAYMLSNSFAEVLTIFIAMVLGWPTPLLVAQILWIHLVCDGPADIVLGFEPKEDGIMDEKPRPLKEPVLTGLATILIGVISVTSALFALYLFNHMYLIHHNAAEGRSAVFASLAINSMVYIFAYRSMRLPIYRMNRLTSNKPLIWAVLAGILTVMAAFWIPWLRSALGLVILELSDWSMIIGFALLLLVFVEIAKAVANRHVMKEEKETRG